MISYRVDYQALKQHNETVSDSAMSAIIFKTKLSSLMKFIMTAQDSRKSVGFWLEN
jgi:hypothetical protein